MTDGRFHPKSRKGPSRRKVLRGGAAIAGGYALAQIGFPAILKAADTIKVGHLTPRTGFLGQLGEYGVRGAQLAVDEVNAAGGAMGRKVDFVTEDSVNPGVAVTKVQKLVERDKVSFLIGEISSASGGAIMEQAKRLKTLYVNSGCNSDALRGAKCNRYTFHVEGCNTMYTKTIGQWQVRQNLIRGAKWYMLTADYAFGHDLFRVSSRFLKQNGGTVVNNDMVPTNTPDYSSYILKIRQAKPDFVYINLAGVDQTTFLKQYREYGLPYKVAGGVMDTVPFWAAGLESLSGYWQSLWYHHLDTAGSRRFTQAYQKRYGGPPDNQAWGDYIGIKIVLQAMEEAKSTDPNKLIEHFEKGAKFDLLKNREGSFRDWDHQLLQEMFVVRVKEPSEAKDKWDIFEIVEPSPAAGEPLDLIQPTKEENPCSFAA
ncbi:MAG: ABC transporter substrate-binding protein [Kiloniellaceae bacterium]